jgi:glyoxylase-like metal-dependent hydrolase (beta-lactamase superfamily II)
MKELAIQLAPNVYRVPTMGNGINSFFFIEDDGSVTLVDTGLKTAPKKISAAIKSLGKDVTDIRKILFTHSHDDHASGAAKIIEIIGTPEVLAHREEVKYLESGENPPRDLTHFAGFIFRFMPKGGFDPIRVDSSFDDRQVLPIAGGLEVMHTPGHTPGHVSFLHKSSGVLITGDSVFNFGFKLAWSLSAFCTSFNQSKETAKKFLDLEFETAAFTHGPHIQNGGKRALEKFLLKN